MSVVSAALKSAFFCTLKMFHFLLQPSLTMEKDGMSQERPSRPSRHPKKKQRSSAEPELSESDEYVDFAESRHCRWWDWDELCCTEHPAGTCAHFPQKILLCCYNNVSNFFPPEHHDKWIKAGGLIKKENTDWSFSPWRALKSPTAAGSTLPMKGWINLDLHLFCWLFDMKSSFNNCGICLKMWQLSNKGFFWMGYNVT